MDQIKNKTFRSETVRLDGKFFLDCSFEDCVLTFGGDRSEWENTTFSGCRVVLDGPANNTVQVLQGLGFKIAAPSEAQSLPKRGRPVH